MTSKADLRAAARAHRKRLRANDPAAADRVATHAGAMLNALFGPDTDGRRLTVALYRPLGAEIDPTPTGLALIELGCALALPSVETRDAPLMFRSWTPGDALAPDQAGIAAPLADAAEVTPDLILTPLLAFDAFGGRLGQGGGYYDRTFAVHPDVARVGLAWAAQAVDHLPIEAHDVPLHGVLTEVGYTPARKAD